MLDFIKIIFASIGVVGMVIICAVACLVLYLLGAALMFILKWGAIVSILLIGVTCIIQNTERPKKK